MTYITLFLLIGIIVLIVGCVITHKTNKEPPCIIGMIFFTLISVVGITIYVNTTKTYNSTKYDLDKLYAYYLTNPNYICKQSIRVKDDYYYYVSDTSNWFYNEDEGIGINSWFTNTITIQQLINGKSRVIYKIYKPSSYALYNKQHWEIFERHKRVINDEKSSIENRNIKENKDG